MSQYNNTVESSEKFEEPKSFLDSKWVWTIPFFLVLLIVILSCLSKDSKKDENANSKSESSITTKKLTDDNNNSTQLKNQNAEKEEIKEKAMVVDYKTLFKDYEDNPIAADEKYRYKKLRVTGSIKKIDREIMQHPYVTFAVKEYFGSVNLYFSKDEESKIAKLKKGQTITVEGNCEGLKLGDVHLNDCILVR